MALKPIWLNSTPEQKTILITLLMSAHFAPSEWEWKGEKYEVQKGQFITSIDTIVKESGKGITPQNVRTALKRFEKLGFLTNESTKTGRLITILNWEVYQSKKKNQQTDEQTDNKELTDDQQTPNKELTPKEESKECSKNVEELQEGLKKDIISDKSDDTSAFKIITDYLNLKAGTKYKHTSKKTRSHIHARLEEGFTVDDFKIVIDKKCKEWNDDPAMVGYIRPETLFGTKFEGYLNQKEKTGRKNGINQESASQYGDIGIVL